MILDRRRANRTLLARQWLLARQDRTALASLTHLVGLQGQIPEAPYIGLWSRLRDFRPEELTSLLVERKVVRMTLQRTTLHVLPADDVAWLRPLLQPMLDLGPNKGFKRELAGLNLVEVANAGRTLLAGATLTRPELGKRLAEQFPDRPSLALAMTVQCMVPLVHTPPSGTWGHHGAIPCTLAEDWLGPMDARPSAETLVVRYLAAFGPATPRDIGAWSGLTRLGGVLERLGAALRSYRDEAGRELFDLADAELADPDVDAPVRFLGAFDNAHLGFADRTRIISDEDRKRLMQDRVNQAFLVDGFVAGTWALRDGIVAVSPYRRLSRPARRAVLDEAAALAAFAGADDVRVG